MKNDCEICGSTFESIRKAKYCEVCRKDTKKAREKIEFAIFMSKKRLGEFDKPEEKVCAYCDKKFFTVKGRRFCSDICQQSHIAETKRCVVCGELISNKREVTSNSTNIKYCSDDCKKQNNRNEIKKCKGCNKEFEATNSQEWCSISCFNANRVRPEKKVTIYERSCIICEKRYKTRNKMQKCCSRDCGRVSAMFEKNKEKKIHEEQRKMMSKRTQIKSKDKPTNLCIDCKTSMKDCEWFSSKYTKHVEGSVGKEVDGKVFLVSCPKYRN